MVITEMGRTGREGRRKKTWSHGNDFNDLKFVYCMEVTGAMEKGVQRERLI